MKKTVRRCIYYYDTAILGDLEKHDGFSQHDIMLQHDGEQCDAFHYGENLYDIFFDDGTDFSAYEHELEDVPAESSKPSRTDIIRWSDHDLSSCVEKAIYISEFCRKSNSVCNRCHLRKFRCSPLKLDKEDTLEWFNRLNNMFAIAKGCEEEG